MKNKDIEIMLENGVPDIPTRVDQKRAVEYVSMVYQGVDKITAYKTVFPDRCKVIAERAKEQNKDVDRTILYYAGKYEEGSYVRSLYSVGQQSYFIQFVDKKTRLLDKLYDIGMDDEESMRNRLNAINTFMKYTPEPEKVVHHKVEINAGEEFRNKLEERKKLLYSIANEQDIIDADVEE